MADYEISAPTQAALAAGLTVTTPIPADSPFVFA